MASAHEVICEQCVRPSHLNWDETGVSGLETPDPPREPTSIVAFAVAAVARELWYFAYPCQPIKTTIAKMMMFFIFGSDGPWLHPGVELSKIFYLKAPAAETERMLSGNILSILGKNSPVHSAG